MVKHSHNHYVLIMQDSRVLILIKVLVSTPSTSTIASPHFQVPTHKMIEILTMFPTPTGSQVSSVVSSNLKCGSQVHNIITQIHNNVCETNNIPQTILGHSHIQSECENIQEYSMKYYQSHTTLLRILIMLWSSKTIDNFPKALNLNGLVLKLNRLRYN